MFLAYSLKEYTSIGQSRVQVRSQYRFGHGSAGLLKNTPMQTVK